MSNLLHRAPPFLSATLFLVASCSQGPGSTGNPSATGDGADGAAGGGTDAGYTTSSSSSGSDDGGAASSGSSGSGSSSSGSGSGGRDASSGAGSSSGGSGSSTGSSGSSGSGGGSSGSSGGSSGAATDSGGTASSCTKSGAACQASNTGCNVGSYYLYDNQWNCGAGSGNSCGPESAYGCTDGDGTVSWVVKSNQPAGNTAVLSYPAMQDNFGSKPTLASFHTITATFSETSPHVGDYEVAWDCWFNDNANEFMIWVDNYNQVPAGNKVATNVSLGGRSYDVWWSPSSGSGGYVVFYANSTVTSGTVDLLQIFNYATAHGWLPATSTVDQLSFGVEVCSTNGQDATWTVSDYGITTN